MLAADVPATFGSARPGVLGKSGVLTFLAAFLGAAAALACFALGVLVGPTIGSGTTAAPEPPLHAGPILFAYWEDQRGGIDGFTALDKGLPGTSSEVKADAWAAVYSEWVAVRRTAGSPPQYVPRERLRLLSFMDEPLRRSAGGRD